MGLLIFLILIALFLAYMYRNEKTYGYGILAIETIGELNLRDLSEASSPMENLDYLQHSDERWNQFENVSYEQMMFKFWKPFTSFYPETYDWVRITNEKWRNQ